MSEDFMCITSIRNCLCCDKEMKGDDVFCVDCEKDDLERQLKEAREENKKLKSGVFVIMRSGANADFPVSFKHTKEEAEAEALKLDKQQKYFPHYVEQLKEKGE